MKKLFLLLVICLTCAAVRANGQVAFFLLSVGTSPAAGSPTIDSLTSGSVTNAATMDLNFSAFTSAYSVIFIEFTAAPITGATNLELLVSSDGSTYNNSAGNYDWYFGNPAAVGGNSTSSPFIQIVGGEVNTAGTRVTGWIQLNDPNSASFLPQLLYTAAGVGTQGYGISGAGRRLTAQVTKAVRLLFSSGNITGTYKVFGMKN